MSDEEALGARGDAAVCRMLDALLLPETAEGEKVSPNCSPQLLCLCSGYRGARRRHMPLPLVSPTSLLVAADALSTRRPLAMVAPGDGRHLMGSAFSFSRRPLHGLRRTVSRLHERAFVFGQVAYIRCELRFEELGQVADGLIQFLVDRYVRVCVCVGVGGLLPPLRRLVCRRGWYVGVG